jgi:hypothetical protein
VLSPPRGRGGTDPIRLLAAGVPLAAALSLASCGGTASTRAGVTAPAAGGSGAEELSGLSIKDALTSGDGSSVDVQGYLFGFGASGGPAVILLCNEPGDPCVTPKLKLSGRPHR